MGFRNPSMQVSGLVPYLGTSLEVYWKFVSLLCACIVTIQSALSYFVHLYYVKPSERDREG